MKPTSTLTMNTSNTPSKTRLPTNLRSRVRPGLLAHQCNRPVGLLTGLGLLAGGLLSMGLTVSTAQAQIYDIDFVTIGDVGNEPYAGDPYGRMAGRGSVDYEYRIGRYEVTTGQWMEFVNTFSTQSDDFTYFASPDFWGAATDPDYSGPGRHYILRSDISTPEMLPVGGISWREAAMYANWLHNNKSSDLSAIQNGAYDTSTFGTNNDNTFNDQLTHNPDARFWIPTLDEWLKAAHYDPNKNGTGQSGWWEYSIMSDEPPIYGIPGEGQANSGFELPGFAEWDIPLGAYEDVTSPWGLFDTAGGGQEWLEEPDFHDRPPEERRLDNSAAGWNYIEAELSDRVSRFSGSLAPHLPASGSFRIATIPSAPALGLAAWSMGMLLIKPRRRIS